MHLKKYVLKKHTIRTPNAGTSLISTAHADGSVSIWDARSLSRSILNFEKLHHHEVRSVQFCPHDESWILSASFDGTVRCVQCTRTTRQKHTLTMYIQVRIVSSEQKSTPTMKWSEHDGKVLRARWGGDVNFVSCSADRTVRVWE